MIRLSKAYTNEPTAVMLAEFKQYCGVADDSRDALLMALLKKAVKMVEDTTARTILAGTCTLLENEREANFEVRLYGDVASITSVTDGEGNALGYAYGADFIKPKGFTDAVEVVYAVAPDAGEAARLMPSVYRYATALYDGAPDSELKAILEGC